jgi:cytochrome c oxidase cbb3-type subunit 2
MPSYSFLFEKRKIAGEEDAEALKLTGPLAPPRGYEIVPSNQARQLVAYLTTLDHSHPLPEAGPNIQPPKPGVSGGSAK